MVKRFPIVREETEMSITVATGACSSVIGLCQLFQTYVGDLDAKVDFRVRGFSSFDSIMGDSGMKD